METLTYLIKLLDISDFVLSFSSNIDFLSANARVLLLLLFSLIGLISIRASAGNRHYFIVVTFFVCLLVPLTSALFPAIDIVIDFNQSVMQKVLPIIDQSPSVLVQNTDVLSGAQIDYFVLFYIATLCVLILNILISNLKVFNLSNKSCPVEQHYWLTMLSHCKTQLNIDIDVKLVYSNLVSSPQTWGNFKPTILIPENALLWPDHLVRSTLLHELSHIKRHDWIVLQACRCICAVYWLNPMIWYLLNKLNVYAETASDDLAVSAGIGQVDYAQDLIHVAEHTISNGSYDYAVLGLVKGSKKSEFHKRITALLDCNITHTPLKRWHMILIFIVGFGLLLPIVSLRANYVERIRMVAEHITVNERYQGPMSDPVQIQTLIAQIENSAQINFAITKTPQASDTESKTRLVSISSIEAVEKIINKISEKIRKIEFVDTSEIVDIPVLSRDIINRQIDAVQSKDHLKTIFKAPQLAMLSSENAPLENNTIALKNDVEALVADKVIPHKVERLVIPKYPRKAKYRGIEGKVIVQFDLDQYGNVTQADIISAEPSNIFNRNVIKAIKKSSFKPKKINGQAVISAGLQEQFVFVLKS